MTNTPLIDPGLPSMGQILKTARLEQNLTLEQIAQVLYINKRQLLELEENEKNLTYDVYTVGFAKLYAEYLKLNPTEIIEKFKEQAAHRSASPQLFFSAPQPGRGMPSFRVIFFSLLLLVGVGIGAKWVNSRTMLAPIPLETSLANKQRAARIKVKQTDLPILPITVPNSLLQQTLIFPFYETKREPHKLLSKEFKVRSPSVTLNAKEKTWIEVKDPKGNIIVSKLFQAGESFVFKNPENLMLKTGNLKGIHLTSDNKVFSIAGKSGEVRRDISLNPEKWIEQKPEID